MDVYVMLLGLLLTVPRILGQVSPTLQTASSVPLMTPSESATSSTGIPTISSITSPTEPSTRAQQEEKGEPKLESQAEAYFYSSDPLDLVSSTCTQAYRLPTQRSRVPPDFWPILRPATSALANAANFLNLIFQASDLRETSIHEDLEWYHALVRSLLEVERPGLVRRALLTFDADPSSPRPQMVLRASQGPNSLAIRREPQESLDILLQDLTSTWETVHAPAPAPDHGWFSALKFAEPAVALAALTKRALLNDLATLDTPKWARGDSYLTNRSGVRWADSAFLECENGQFLPGWLLTLSTPFYGLKPDLSPEFRGVIRVDVNVQGFDIDQCASGDVWFADTHQCNRTSMVCEPIPGQGFRLGQYCCQCKEGYYSPSSTKEETDPRGDAANDTRTCYPALPVCLPCWPGCTSCDDGSPCLVEEDWLLRAAVLAVQGLFMLLVFVSMLGAYQFRRSKRVRASGLLLLETILFGSLLLYFPVFILYFKPSIFRCILLRWVRLLGFAIVYGTVTLKMYRILKVFLSRTAQRVSYMSSMTLLRMVGVMVLTVSWFLCAWTVGVLQNRDRNIPLLITSTTSDGKGFSLCDLDRWDYMMAVAELLFLCWGSFLWRAVKTVPSAFHEPRYMGIAIHNELFLSSMFHLLRFVRPSLHPDWMLLLFFTHTHFTITVTLGLLFIPKFLYVSQPGREEIAEVYEDEVDLRRSGSYLNSSFNSAWSEHSLEPDDIRDELKKLYGQIEAHKTKKMMANNPHLQKKRSFGLGRSIMKRITEIPETMSRQCSREDRDSCNRSSFSHSLSSRKATDTASINYKDETLKQPTPILRKSLSTYDHVPERDYLILGSSKNKMDKRASQHSEGESIDTAPLVCKSASAHNLSDNNLLHPDQSRYQKSLSVIVSNKEYYPLSSSKSLEDTSQAGRVSPSALSRSDSTARPHPINPLLLESFDKAEVCPWEVEEERPANKNQKHVTYYLSENRGSLTSETAQSPKKLICPWENVDSFTFDKKERSGEGADLDADSSRPQAPISSSAPGSPAVIKSKELRVFSFRSATQSLLVAKGLVVPGRSSTKDKSKKQESVKDKKEEATSHKVQVKDPRLASAKLSPARAADIVKKTPQTQIRSMTTDSKPCLVKQAAIRLSSTDSSEKSPIRHLSSQSFVCPWESGEVQTETKKHESIYENVCTQQRRTGYQSKLALTAPHADSCSWDPSTPIKHVPQGHMTDVATVCPWDAGESDESQNKNAATLICPWETQSPAKGGAHAESCPWDTQETGTTQVRQDSVKSLTGTMKHTERVIYVNSSRKTEALGKVPKRQETTRTEVCPWESAQTVLKQESVRSEVCPWESTEVVKNQESTLSEVCPWESTETVAKQENVRSDVCPWESAEKVVKQETVQSEVCPWESAETVTQQESGRSEVCPWESADSMTKQESIRSEIGSWASTDTVKKQGSVLSEVCPWESAEAAKKQESLQSEVCIRESGETFQEPENTHTDICSGNLAGPTCTQDSHQNDEVIKTSSTMSEPPMSSENGSTDHAVQEGARQTKDQGSFAHVCPRDTNETTTPEDTRPDKSPEPSSGDFTGSTTSEPTQTKTATPPPTNDTPTKMTDVCPWETDTTEKSIQRQTTTKEDVCPWEINEHEQPKRQDSCRANICPWETSDDNIIRQKSLADVCPWETPEDTISRQKSLADVCPWETPDDKINRQKSLVDVCPWETQESETNPQESVRTNVCPWEAENEEQCNMQNNVEMDALPSKPDDTEIQQADGNMSASQQETRDVCESTTEEPAKEMLQVEYDARANLPLARRDAMCPWDVDRAKYLSSPDHETNSDVFIWEENIPEEEEDGDAESAAEAFIFTRHL
ncbi:probable G-protein coupled receptor 158 [Denticeps clupeoides]|uniref:G-protein coupled receptors family 3 profile domain-containing protein n=1 Tax=Denticeps clupeoides TaxID=299321 RepID=A0AAY4DHW4_9TELE|nr:probable G-protein coupled receptor 158 [Denticeps clupeoides]